MPPKSLSLADRLLIEFDKGLRNLVNNHPKPQTFGDPVAVDNLSDEERKLSARLMRVNHAGEVAAQALYHGQSLTAREPDIQAAMDEAAREEKAHLAWCSKRLDELGGSRSLLDPIWYAGSFTIGAAAGIAGDRWSLGFVAETERQVVKHLDRHLAKLPANDTKSRAVLEQMKADEQRHGDTATRAGGSPLPRPIKGLMGLVSKIMTQTALWI